MSNKNLYYIVGDSTPVYNQYLANKMCHDLNSYRRFYVFENQFDSVDWTTEPSETYDSLCRERALQLRAKWPKLSLLFSGGSDTSDIIRIFLENKIPLDELIVFRHKYNPLRCFESDRYIIPLAQWYCQQQSGLTLKVYDVEQTNYEKEYSSSDWLEAQGKMTAQMGMSSYLFNDLLENKRAYSAVSNTGYICGLEKARLWINDNKWYMRQIDKIFEYQNLHQPSLEFFYLAPEMPKFYVKQCWQLIHHLESKFDQFDEQFIVDLYNSKSTIYKELVAGSHRRFFKDAGKLTPTMITNGSNKIQAIDQDFGNLTLQQKAKHEGWRCIKNYQDVVNHLRKNESHLFNQGEPLKGLIGTWGKPYYIKPVMKKQEKNFD